jgi:cytochrome c peroxidase
LAVSLSATAGAQRGGIATLKGVVMPQPAGLARYVADSQALIVLGTAPFRDVQVGSDGRTACATCHFHAGADHRLTNQIAGAMTATAAVRPNTTLRAADFPFRAFSNPNDNTSAATQDWHGRTSPPTTACSVRSRVAALPVCAPI